LKRIFICERIGRSISHRRGDEKDRAPEDQKDPKGGQQLREQETPQD